MQTDLNFLMPTALAFGAVLALALALATQSGAPNSGLLLMPGTVQFGPALS